jgi:hypothetical protein
MARKKLSRNRIAVFAASLMPMRAIEVIPKTEGMR